MAATVAPMATRKRKRASLREEDKEKEEEKNLVKELTTVLKKARDQRTDAERTLLRSHPDHVIHIQKRLEKYRSRKARQEEYEEPESVIADKSAALAEAIRTARHLVVYTGAGVSTSASIPDYRGPDGIWTRISQGRGIGDHDLTAADPTLTHMALYGLWQRGRVRHVVSQNCDGLHLRSGLPKRHMSELHGNMYLEVCASCPRQYVRSFDVTPKTSRQNHKTGRRCYECGTPLIDTVVHFGERGSLRWPLNWRGACRQARRSDVILCLGSSLKVLRKYSGLWCMHRPPHKRPRLFIVNLQWTPKDDCAALKINGRCDDVMSRVMQHLGLPIPRYSRAADPLFRLATPLHRSEPPPPCRLTRPDTPPPEEAEEPAPCAAAPGRPAECAVSPQSPPLRLPAGGSLLLHTLLSGRPAAPADGAPPESAARRRWDGVSGGVTELRHALVQTDPIEWRDDEFTVVESLEGTAGSGCESSAGSEPGHSPDGRCSDLSHIRLLDGDSGRFCLSDDCLDQLSTSDVIFIDVTSAPPTLVDHDYMRVDGDDSEDDGGGPCSRLEPEEEPAEGGGSADGDEAPARADPARHVNAASQMEPHEPNGGQTEPLMWDGAVQTEPLEGDGGGDEDESREGDGASRAESLVEGLASRDNSQDESSVSRSEYPDRKTESRVAFSDDRSQDREKLHDGSDVRWVESLDENGACCVESLGENGARWVESLDENGASCVESLDENGAGRFEPLDEDGARCAESPDEDGARCVESLDENGARRVESPDENVSNRVESLDKNGANQDESPEENGASRVEPLSGDGAIRLQSRDEDGASRTRPQMEDDASQTSLNSVETPSQTAFHDSCSPPEVASRAESPGVEAVSEAESSCSEGPAQNRGCWQELRDGFDASQHDWGDGDAAGWPQSRVGGELWQDGAESSRDSRLEGADDGSAVSRRSATWADLGQEAASSTEGFDASLEGADSTRECADSIQECIGSSREAVSPVQEGADSSRDAGGGSAAAAGRRRSGRACSRRAVSYRDPSSSSSSDSNDSDASEDAAPPPELAASSESSGASSDESDAADYVPFQAVFRVSRRMLKPVLAQDSGAAAGAGWYGRGCKARRKQRRLR